MKKIISFRTKGPRNDELFKLFQRVLKLAQALLTQETDAAIVAAFKKAVDDFDAALKQSVKLKNTEALEVADRYVDEIYRGLRLYARAIELHPEANMRTLAKDVMFVLDKYGDIVNLPYNQQYGAIHNSMQELNALPAETLSTLVLAPWLEGLAVAVAQFDSVQEKQTSEKGDYQVGLVKEAREAAELAFRKFTDSVNAFAIAFGEENYAKFIDDTNAIIEDMKATLKTRSTYNAKDKENNSQETTDGETESTDSVETENV